MRNPRINAKERGLIKGALRRVFSRSELRREALDLTRVQHEDPERPRVKKWSKCTQCKELTPTYKLEIDHIEPVVPTNKSLDDMTWDELVDRIWCPKNNLTGICKLCHNIKTKLERKERTKHKKEKKTK